MRALILFASFLSIGAALLPGAPLATTAPGANAAPNALLPPATGPAATLVHQARAAERIGDVDAALRLYRAADAAEANNAFILQKIAKQLSDSTDEVAEPEVKAKLADEALDYAERALRLAPRNPECLLSISICWGHLAGAGDTRTRIEASRKVKQYAEAALAADPDYAWAHHVLGRWNEEVAAVSGPARAMARLFSGGLPPASLAAAIAHLKQAVALQPEQAAHHLELGFAYWKNGDKAAALEQLHRGLALPAEEKHDQTLQQRARALLASAGEK